MEIKNGKRRLVGFVDIRRLQKNMTKLEGKYSGLSSFKVLCPSPLIQVLSQSLLYDYISQLNLLQSRNQYTGMILIAHLIILSFILFFRLLGKEETQLASHVLQFIFLSDCGFRFPIVQFPSHDCTPMVFSLSFDTPCI